MRVSIVLNDDLVREARRFSSARTRAGLVEEALRTFIKVKEAARQCATYSRCVSDLDRKLSGLVLRESPESVLRSDRERTISPWVVKLGTLASPIGRG